MPTSAWRIGTKSASTTITTLGFRRTNGLGEEPAFAAEQRTTRRLGKIAERESERRKATRQLHRIVAIAFDLRDALEGEPVFTPGGRQLSLQAAPDLREQLRFARGERFGVERAVQQAAQGEKAVEGGREEEVVELCEHFHVQNAQQNAFPVRRRAFRVQIGQNAPRLRPFLWGLQPMLRGCGVSGVCGVNGGAWGLRLGRFGRRFGFTV